MHFKQTLSSFVKRSRLHHFSKVISIRQNGEKILPRFPRVAIYGHENRVHLTLYANFVYKRFFSFQTAYFTLHANPAQTLYCTHISVSCFKKLENPMMWLNHGKGKSNKTLQEMLEQLCYFKTLNNCFYGYGAVALNEMGVL